MASKTILVIEDNDIDYETVERAFKKVSNNTTVFRCNNGDGAINFLLNNQLYPQPDLILLDLNLPGTSGTKLLNLIKQRSTLKKIPVIVLSGSKNITDVNFAYKNGANSYLKKPLGFAAFTNMIKHISDLWLHQPQSV